MHVALIHLYIEKCNHSMYILLHLWDLSLPLIKANCGWHDNRGQGGALSVHFLLTLSIHLDSFSKLKTLLSFLPTSVLRGGADGHLSKVNLSLCIFYKTENDLFCEQTILHVNWEAWDSSLMPLLLEANQFCPKVSSSNTGLPSV